MKPFDALQLANALHPLLLLDPVLTHALIDSRDNVRLEAHALFTELLAEKLPFEFRRRELETCDN